MKKIGVLWITVAGLLFFCCNKAVNNENGMDAPVVDYTDLAGYFKSPDALYGVDCWWWWLNGNVTKEAITKDLEAMKSRNFYGAMIFDAGGHNLRGNKDIPAGPLFGSEEWINLFVFALDEAKRLGLEIGFNIQSGWNLGGPRVTPQYAAKQLTYSETKITGGSAVNVSLETPRTHNSFYKDIAVLALPLKNENITGEEITFLDMKLGYHELGVSAPDCRFLLDNTRPDNRMTGKTTFKIKKDEIIDITRQMDAGGNLAWKAPEGEWSIMRIGYTCTNAEVSISSSGWQGDVLDYMSRDAFDFYWNDVVEPILKASGDHTGTTLKNMETDSWECGGMNWTDNFREEFKSYRGYDPLIYLPVIGGYVMEDVNVSNAFLADFRKTIADLVANNHYARFAELAHKHNMGIQPESAGPHAGPLDGITNYGFSDIVMSEFWSPSPHRPRPQDRFFLKQASSAAHIYGKRIVGAESFTTIGPHWNDELWRDQKSSFDHEVCAGLNRLYFHTFTCSPPEMGLPGQEYFAGTHVNPQVTWWNESAPFIDYLNRTQAIVQNGKFMADVLYYYGDHVPNVFPYKHSDPAGAMPGFDYDVTNEDVLLKLTVRDGKLTVPGGIEYKVLVLPGHKVLSLDALKKIDELLRKGAAVIGYRPEHYISLSGGDKAQKQFRELADKIWGKEASDKGMGIFIGRKTYGKGVVAWGVSAREFLTDMGVKPDFTVAGNDSKTDFDYIHYTVAGKDVYFVSNQTEERQKINCTFRVSGFRPEIWDALTGDIRTAKAFTQSDGLTTVPLTLEP
ncbi:MAG: glycoside hydrolase, partial [Tannerella sp.]|nr:glycoside hydrolase [Tannerella sp.]